MDFTSEISQLYAKISRWTEEVTIYSSDETELTIDAVNQLLRQTRELEKSLRMLKAEARRLLAL